MQNNARELATAYAKGKIEKPDLPISMNLGINVGLILNGVTGIISSTPVIGDFCFGVKTGVQLGETKRAQQAKLQDAMNQVSGEPIET